MHHYTEWVQRVDCVFDIYRYLSIKMAEREKRGKNKHAVRCVIHSRQTKFPSNWSGFLSLTQNKQELVKFLCQEVLAACSAENKLAIVSGGVDNFVAYSTYMSVAHLSSTQEEADTRILLHAQDAVRCGYDRVIANSPDTDVLNNLAAHEPQLGDAWLHTGTGDNK